MPQLVLDGTGDDFIWLQAVMLFPKHVELREQMYASLVAQGYMEGREKNEQVTLDVDTVRLLINGPSKADLIAARKRAFKNGLYSGYILSAIYLMSRFPDAHPHFSRPSIKKAIHVTRQFAISPLGRFGDGEKMVYSPQKIRECWEQYKPVAHLWSAFALNEEYGFMESKWPSTAEELQQFLAAASGVYQFGSSFVPKATKPPLPVLSMDDPWLISEAIQPKILNSDRVPLRLVEYMNTYKHTG